MSSFKSIAAALIGVALTLGGASSVYAQEAAEEANATEAPKSGSAATNSSSGCVRSN
jgi:hypothetical protein